MNYWKLTTALCLIIDTAALYAKSYIPNCPKQINRIEHINVAPNNWETIADIPNNFLSSISFYYGHPKEGASLRPNSANKKMAKWRFSSKQKIYIVCEYHQTGIKLTQPLALKTTECTINYNLNVKGNNGFLPKSISCVK